MNEDTKRFSIGAVLIAIFICLAFLSGGSCSRNNATREVEFATTCINRGGTYVPQTDKVVGICVK